MKTHILAAAAIAGFLALSSAAFAQSTDTAPAMRLAQSSTSLPATGQSAGGTLKHAH